MAGCVTPPRIVQVPPPPPPTPVAAFPALVRIPAESLPSFSDDADTASLHTAALASAAYYRMMPPDTLFSLAGDTYSARDLASSMDYLASILESTPNKMQWLARIGSDFAVYQSVGVDPRRTVTFSSYYEPTIHARLQPDTIYRYPLYGRPPDLVNVDLGLFGAQWQGTRLSGRVQGLSLVPYPVRGDIDSGGLLRGKGLEIAWARDPLDIFFLQIEGSGWLDLGKGKMVRIRYDGDNGRRYRSVGQYMIASGRVHARGFDHNALVRYMKRHPQERQDLLNVDERYVFFQIDTSTTSAFAYGNISQPLTAGRSVATDPKVFPKGALAWIDVQAKPPTRRFVLNQDEGGAIQGPGRVDFFAGHGKKAEHLATHFWYPGQLYFLVKKKESPLPPPSK